MESPFEQLSAPSHTCLIYQTREQQIAFTAHFLRAGLERGERCVFLEMPEKLDEVRKALHSMGVKVEEDEKRGALVLTANRVFLQQGAFDADRCLAFLETGINQAVADGFAALRITGDMNWELGRSQDFGRLLHYEAKLDEFLLDKPIVGVCQYQRYTVSSHAICNALETHRTVVLGTEFCTDNVYYEPPEVKLEQDPERREQRRGEWMCRQLVRSRERAQA
jgi:hypothetical protein